MVIIDSKFATWIWKMHLFYLFKNSDGNFPNCFLKSAANWPKCQNPCSAAKVEICIFSSFYKISSLFTLFNLLALIYSLAVTWYFSKKAYSRVLSLTFVTWQNWDTVGITSSWLLIRSMAFFNAASFFLWEAWNQDPNSVLIHNTNRNHGMSLWWVAYIRLFENRAIWFSVSYITQFI